MVDQSTKPIHLEDLHGASFVWENSDGETVSEPLTCGQDECSVCGGPRNDAPETETRPDDAFQTPIDYEVTT